MVDLHEQVRPESSENSSIDVVRRRRGMEHVHKRDHGSASGTNSSSGHQFALISEGSSTNPSSQYTR